MIDENVSMDATTAQAEEIIRAAMAWRFDKGADPLMDHSEWRLYEACNQYGDRFKGVRGQ